MVVVVILEDSLLHVGSGEGTRSIAVGGVESGDKQTVVRPKSSHDVGRYLEVGVVVSGTKVLAIGDEHLDGRLGALFAVDGDTSNVRLRDSQALDGHRLAAIHEHEKTPSSVLAFNASVFDPVLRNTFRGLEQNDIHLGVGRW